MGKFIKTFVVIAALCSFCSCEKDNEKNSSENSKGGKNMIKVTSSAFENDGMIPAKYTCDGENISPPLKFDQIPANTKSIALICDDPDAPMGTFVHWVMYNLPPTTNELTEKFPDDETLLDGTRQGINDFGTTGYSGPCPPSGIHRYFFKVYALNSQIDSVPVADKKHLLKAMEGKIIATGQLMGKYKRK